MMDKVVPNFYRRLRQKRQMSQSEFGLAVGKKREAIANWESGQTRPSYDDERRLLIGHGCSRQEILEILSEALAAAMGQPITILFEAREPAHPAHPLTVAERRLQESGCRLPEKLRQQLLRRIFAARANVARIEGENGDVLEHVEACIKACGRPASRNTTEQEGEPTR